MLGIIISLFDILGDVCESFVKRLGEVKDSGTFFTGHGGILDRFDSFYFVAPVTVYYLHYVLGA
jgi:phosphatidate cytidylyltransferase